MNPTRSHGTDSRVYLERAHIIRYPSGIRPRSSCLGWVPIIGQLLKAAAGGALSALTATEIFQLLEELAWSTRQGIGDRTAPRKTAGVIEMDTLTALTAQMAANNRTIGWEV
jgi:hypothetical protein